MKIHKRRARRARVRVAAAMVAAVAAGPLALATPAHAAGGLTIIAHRGDAAARPESTNTAFRSAVNKGADAIEMDVWFSRTGYPVIMHDKTMDRTTNCSGPISNKTVTQIEKCDAGSWFSAAYKGTKVPTLRSALANISAASHSVKVLLHMKQYPTNTEASRVRSYVHQYGMGSRTIIISDYSSILTKMRSYGFSQLGRVFNNPAAWNEGWKYMIPYETPLNYAAISRIHARGGKVWPVESHPSGLTDLLHIGQLDGILVNHLTLALK